MSAYPLTEEVTMFRTSRTARRGRVALTWMGEWKLPGTERRVARSEREAERQLQRERDNDNEHRAENRAAAVEAKARHDRSDGYGGMI